MHRRFVPLAAGIAVLAGCGEKTIRPEGAERSVREVVAHETGFRVKDVGCPSGVEAEEGKRFRCVFTGPEGPYTAFVRIRRVDGDDVLFHIVTRPTNANR